MTTRTLEIKFIGDASGAKKAFAEVDDSSGKLTGKLDGIAGAAGKAVIGLGAIGTGATIGGLALSVNAAANFEHALDQVGAVANATAEDMKGLSNTALRIGKDTAFSATEAAGAMEMLAANGVSVADIMNGAADAAVALAAAGGTDLATAADTASTAMAVWGLTAANMADVVNRLAGAANVSRFGVEDMSLAIAAGGGAAKTAGVEFEDFSAAIAAIAPSFSSGQDAGTSMKTFLANLVPDTKKAKDAFAELGITTEDGSNRFFDAGGNLKSMAEIVEVLNDATRDLSEEQKTQALSTMFGSDAMRAAAALAGLTAQEFQGLQDTMGDTDAADVAAQRMGNFKGSMEALKGSLETIQIEIGMKLLPVLTRLSDWAAKNLPVAFAYIETEVMPRAVAAFQSIQAAVQTFAATVEPHLRRFGAEAQVQFAKFQLYYQTDLKPALDNIAKAVEFAVNAVIAAWQKLQPVIQPILEQVANVVEHTVRTIALALGIVIDLLGGDFSGAWAKAKDLVAEQIRYIKETVENLGALIRGAIPLIAEAAKAVGSAIFDAIWEGLGDLWQVGADIINWMLQGLKAMAWQIEQWVTNFAKGIIDKLDPRKWDIPGLSPFIQAYGHAGQLAGSAMMSGMASQVTAEAGKVTSALSAAATLDPRGDDPKALADAIWDWHNDPMFGFVTPAAPGITWGSNGKNVAPVSQATQVIQLVVDGQVLAETVAQHQARAY